MKDIINQGIMNKRQKKKQTKKGENRFREVVSAQNIFFGSLVQSNIASGFVNNVSFFGFSKQGHAHWLYNEECQDDCAVIYSNKRKCLIIAIADGIGSREQAKCGAKISVTESVNYAFQHMENDTYEITDDSMKLLLKGAMEKALDTIKEKAQKEEKSIDEYGSTLTISIFDGSNLYIGHIGDDGVLAISNEGFYGLITTRHKGKDPSSLYPLKVVDKWEFLHASNICGFVMATDGVLDALVHSQEEDSRVFLPILEAAMYREFTSPEEVRHTAQEYHSFFDSENVMSVITDDITFMCVFNEKTKHGLSRHLFDSSKWSEQNKKFAMDNYELEAFEKKDQALMEGLPGVEFEQTVQENQLIQGDNK